MRTSLVVVLCLLLGPAHAGAEEPPATKAPPKVVRAKDVAALVRAAIQAKDATALKALASKDQPDPWMVADLLCDDDAHDDAEAFARAAPRPAIEKLPAHVTSRRSKEADAKAVAVFDAMRKAHMAGDAEGEVKAAAALAAPPGSLRGILVFQGHGMALRGLSRYAPSYEALNAGAEAAHKIGWLKRAYFMHRQAGLSAAYGRMWAQAQTSWELCGKLSRTLGNRKQEFESRLDAAGLHAQMGRPDLALAGFDSVRRDAEAAGDRRGVANALMKQGSLQRVMRRFPAAIASLEAAMAAYASIPDPGGVGDCRGFLGVIHLMMGAYEKAIKQLEAALPLKRKQGLPRQIMATLGNLGLALFRVGRYEDALAVYEEILPQQRAIRDASAVAATLHNIGGAHYALGRMEEAIAGLTEALAIKRKLGDDGGAAGTLINIGMAHARLARYEEAITVYEAALAAVEKHPDPDGEARALLGLATVLLRLERTSDATKLARRGVEVAVAMSRGLASGEGAAMRDAYEGLFGIGVTASAQSGDMDGLLWFLEQGRAGSLLEMIGTRDELESAVVPSALKERLDAARVAERGAAKVYRRAVSRRNLRALKAAREAWAVATEAVTAVELTIQREARAAATLTLGVTEDVASLRKALGAGEAFVSFGHGSVGSVGHERLIACIVWGEGARMVDLGEVSVVDKACAALALDDPSTDATAALATVSKLVAAPLGLGTDIQRVLISPIGRLGYVPFRLLLPGREIAYVPSATTHSILAGSRVASGKRVLAVGDPDYSARAKATSRPRSRAGFLGKLSQLPATRVEVERVGDVRLLGAEATEARVRAALAEDGRWRAIHFACHGLVDPEEPGRSALAITPDGTDDGFLTGLDIFKLRFAADLVVLSACETGKGKVFRTEGIVGLTHAFMFAGAPRVICSLWKVDDDATRALMVKFYDLWNPKDGKGLSAAAALQKAQEHIRAQPQWKHPYYWAAWVLWGLPD